VSRYSGSWASTEVIAGAEQFDPSTWILGVSNVFIRSSRSPTGRTEKMPSFLYPHNPCTRCAVPAFCTRKQVERG